MADDDRSAPVVFGAFATDPHAVNKLRCILFDRNDWAALGADATDFAQALVVSEPWRAIRGEAVVVVSPDMARIALIGDFDDTDDARIGALRTQLDVSQRGFRYVGYEDAEQLVAVLATKVADVIGSQGVDAAHLIAIPRGGHLVLGMLAYALPAGAEELEPDGAELWIVVDDCSLSGARFMRWLEAHPGPDVVFAHLYSHPDLRAILARHPRVRACVAAADLADHAPARLGAGYGEWLTAWSDRDSGVWAGQTDRIAFAWNEPDTSIWNPVTGEIERGWRLVGPKRCFKNRGDIPDGAIQVLSPAYGELRPGPNVMWAVLGEEVVLADTKSGDVIGLSGVGAARWLAGIESATETETLHRLGSRFAIEAARLRSDYEHFIEQLEERNLVIRT